MKALLVLLLVSCGPMQEDSMAGARPPIPGGRSLRGGALTAQEQRRNTRVLGDRTAVGLPEDFQPAHTLDPMMTVNGRPFAVQTQVMTRLKNVRNYSTKSVQVGIFLPALASVVIGAAIYRYDSGNDPTRPLLTLLGSGFKVVLNGDAVPTVVDLDQVVEFDENTAYVLMIFYDGTDPNVLVTYHVASSSLPGMSSLEYTDTVIAPGTGFPRSIQFKSSVSYQQNTVYAAALPTSGFGLIY